MTDVHGTTLLTLPFSEQLAGAKIEHKEVAQSVASQKAKLTEVFVQINHHLQVSGV